MNTYVVMTATRHGACGEVFTTVDLFPHTPVSVDRTVAGWDGTGAGLSEVDLKEIHRLLDFSCGAAVPYHRTDTTQQARFWIAGPRSFARERWRRSSKDRQSHGWSDTAPGWVASNNDCRNWTTKWRVSNNGKFSGTLALVIEDFFKHSMISRRYSLI